MQDTEFAVGKEVKRFAGQLLGCMILSCENNKDFHCYCQQPCFGKVDGMPLPACLSYVGKLLDYD